MPRKRTHFKPKRAVHSLMSRVLAYIASMFSKVKVEGIENIPSTGGAIIICNHLSLFDAVALTTALDQSKRDVMVLAKAELFQVKPMAWALRQVGAIPVFRGSERAAEALSEASKSLRHGEIIAMFPEGTIPSDGRFMEFKTGAARLALETRVPVIPMAMVGTEKIIAPNMTKIKRTLWKNSFLQPSIKVKIGKPLLLEGSMNDHENVFVATEKLHATVGDLLNDLGYDPDGPAKIAKKRKCALAIIMAFPALAVAIKIIARLRKS